MKTRTIAAVVAVWCMGTTLGAAQAHQIIEASGIARKGDTLIMVGDRDQGWYFKYYIGGLNLSGSAQLADQARITRITMLSVPLPVDLEGVATLEDGSVIVASERLRSVLTASGTLTTFLETHGEYANRGIEGVATRPDTSQSGRTALAVVWEGGYPARADLPNGVGPEAGDHAMRPVVVIDTVTSTGAVGTRAVIRLDTGPVNGWVDQRRPRGQEPDAYRFRAPDLVWHKNGFIVLLSSERSPTALNLGGGERFGPKVLQRYDTRGRPLGTPFDLDAALTAVGASPGRNWEGMGWFVEGESLVFVFDTNAHPPTVAIVDIPTAWR